MVPRGTGGGVCKLYGGKPNRSYAGQTPDCNPANFARGSNGDRINKNDGSIWSPNKDGHGGTTWKSWPNAKDHRNNNRESIRPDGSCR